MDQENSNSDPAEPSAPLGRDLLQALNAAAAFLQGSSQSEAEVFQAFKEQITRLGLRGTLSLLDESGEMLTFHAVALPRGSLATLEAVAGITAEGYQIPLKGVEQFRRVLQARQAIYYPDTRNVIEAMIPLLARPLTQPLLRLLGTWPGIYTPLISSQATVIGLLTVAGPGLVEQDAATITAFANHIAIALQNARLFQAVRQAETQYRRLFETALEGIIVFDPATNRIISANARAADLTGYSQAELRTITVRDLYRPEREAITREALETLYRQGRHVFELTLYRRDGQEWIAEISAAHYEVDGQPMVQGAMRDVTAQRQAEEALRQSQEQFRIVTENAPGVIYLCDNDANFTMRYLNPAVETITGYPPAYFLEQGHSIAELYHPNDAPYINPEDEAQLKRRRIYQLTYRLRHRSGDYRWVEDFGGGVFNSDGRLLYLAGFISDITERVEAQEALQESQRALSTLISNLPGMAYRCRSDYHWTDEFVSEGSYELTGYRPDELVGGGVIFAELIHPDDRAQTWLETQKALADHRPFRFTYRLQTKSGQEKWVWEQGRGVYDRDGQVVALEGFVTDITERKLAEEVLRQAQKMESLGILAGGVAHDFNNLLAAMMGQASLARAKLLSENPARSHVEKLVKAVERASDLTHQLLAYSGRGQFSLTLMDLNTLIQENYHLLEASIPKNVRLQLALSEPLHLIEADLGQMQQVVMNLILNAAEAIGSRPGMVTITTGVQIISAADERYWRMTSQPLAPGPYVFLQVEDNGSGMNEETMRRIFDPFFTTKFTGRGLGLAAVLGIVRGHQGGLHVTSQPGQGTRFRLVFPASDEIASAPLDHQGSTVNSGSQPGNLILVIDDEELIREATTDILELEGLRVVTAADGEEGIEIYRRQGQEIDLVLLDLSMPGLSGYDTFRALQEINPNVRVILSSGYNQSEAMRHFEGKGVSAFVQKPYDMDKLLSEIRRNLERFTPRT